MRIIVAVDGSPQAALGAAWTTQLALTEADEVIVASIAERPVLLGAWGYVHIRVTEDLMGEAWLGVQSGARRAVEEAASLVASAGCPVRAVVVEGHPIPGLIDLVDQTDADLIVVGPHGQGRLESILLGSVSQALLHAMPTSVLVAREPVQAPRRVLIATDGSPHSLAAARFLARLPLPANTWIGILVAVDLAREIRARRADGRAGPRGARGVPVAEIVGATAAALESGGRTGTPVVRQGDAKRAILAAASGSTATSSSRARGDRRLPGPPSWQRLARRQQGRSPFHARRGAWRRLTVEGCPTMTGLRILCTTDGSAGAADALEMLVASVEPGGVEIKVLSVVPRTTRWPGPGREDRRPSRSSTQPIAPRPRRPFGRRSSISRQQASAPGRRSSEATRRRRSCPSNAHLPDLIVVGTRGLGTLRRQFAGSVSGKVARYAPTSVLVAWRSDQVRRIVLGYDASPGADLALGLVARLPFRHAVSVTVCAVYETVAPLVSGVAPTMVAQVHAAHREDLREAQQRPRRSPQMRPGG